MTSATVRGPLAGDPPRAPERGPGRTRCFSLCPPGCGGPNMGAWSITQSSGAPRSPRSKWGRLWTYSDGSLTAKGYLLPSGTARAASWVWLTRRRGFRIMPGESKVYVQRRTSSKCIVNCKCGIGRIHIDIICLHHRSCATIHILCIK